MMETQFSPSIKAINKEAVHRICSGQVVLSLAVAVKELVENSLDAGSTAVEVRLREHGSELVEVSDNGSGVEPHNFQGLTLKHHTSKLQDFSDLVSVETFGFRGEALSSLCSLSDLTVTTRHASADCGTRLVFDHNGKIVSSTSVARQVGTTVTLENIFSTLPVRHKEFHRNLKREFAKMTQLLYAYCLVSAGVKITCTHQRKKGGREVVVSTQACNSIRENIACVFGSKQLNGLLEVKTVAPSDETLEELNLKVSSAEVVELLSLEGFVSSCAHGQGRSTNDRQFYFVNSRPCEPTKVIKAVNEVYHQYNANQQPFVFLNVSSARDGVDVNVTPDKRQVFLEHEKMLVATVKASLHALYRSIPSTYTLNSRPSLSPSVPSVSANQSPSSILSQWRHPSSGKRPSLDNLTSVKSPKQAKLDLIFTKKETRLNYIGGSGNQSNFNHPKEANINTNSITFEVLKSINALTIPHQEERNSSPFDTVKDSPQKGYEDSYADSTMNQNDNREVDLTNEDEEAQARDTSSTETFSQTSNKSLTLEASESEKNEEPVLSSQESLLSNFTPSSSDGSVSSSNQLSNNKATSSANTIDRSTDDVLVNDVKTRECVTVSVDREFEGTSDRTCKEIPLSMALLRRYTENLTLSHDSGDGAKVRFRAVIEPSKNKQAEEELSREITKDMFAKMEVIGQFNLGFIIARLGGDLFIVDQHATDEKYNFETLQRTTTISSQKLVVPQQLELTAINESILIDNVNIFKANGFEFSIDENAPSTTKVKLTTIPMSRNWTFGKDDIDELLFMLQDAPNTLCRPSRVRAMFASRACRKSVMIGKALSKAEMKRLLVHMGEIEQPWDCPHGRPTMRHLINLDFI